MRRQPTGSWATCRHCDGVIYEDRGLWRHGSSGRMACPSMYVAEPVVVTPSQADRQPPASSSETKGGSSAVAPDDAKRPDLVTHHEET